MFMRPDRKGGKESRRCQAVDWVFTLKATEKTENKLEAGLDDDRCSVQTALCG